MKILLVVVAVIGFIAQLYVPASMIAMYEDILENGSVYKFKVRPVDPADPFRGRYVRLAFETETGIYVGDDVDFKYNEKGYALLARGDNDLVKVAGLVKQQPTSGDYVQVRVFGGRDNTYNVRFPFNRYYAEEFKAPDIETSVRDNSREIVGGNLVFADVRIKNGKGVIDELYVGKQTIHEFLESKN